MSDPKRIVIIGATSAIAEHCARQWLQQAPAHLTLIGRDVQRTERVAADLRVRSAQSTIDVLTADFIDPAAIQATVNAVTAHAPIDIVLIAHGALPEHAECQKDLKLCRDALEVNAISPVLWAEAFAGRMQAADHGTLILLGSVAGDRGRKSNYVYGAAKGLVTRYAQGLQHRLAATRVKVVLVKPGPTDTPMTAHLKGLGAKLAPVEQVARCIVRGAGKGKAVVYAPGKWALIMWVVRHLPSVVFNRIEI